ncbi:MAG: hypothetical protein ACK4VM_11280 [Bosea sp. (in: a-proteobacteria)]
MRRILLVTVPRILLGLLFLVSAVDGFWWLASGQHLIHPPVTDQGRAFETALQNSGFFWPLLKTVNLLGALSLLFNIVPAFGLALIAPVMAVIVAFTSPSTRSASPSRSSWSSAADCSPTPIAIATPRCSASGRRSAQSANPRSRSPRPPILSALTLAMAMRRCCSWPGPK